MLIITAPGQGAQTPGFLAPWLELPGVAERLGAASELAGCDLIRFGTTASADEIKDTAVAQPLLVAAAIVAASALSDPALPGSALPGSALPGGVPGEAPADAAAGHSVGAPAAAALRDAAADVMVTDPAMTLLSDADGAAVTTGKEWLERIVAQVAAPVRWDLCMRTMADLGVTALIELPPAGTLTGLARRVLPGVAQLAIKTPEQLDAARELIAGHLAEPDAHGHGHLPEWRLIVAPASGTFRSGADQQHLGTVVARGAEHPVAAPWAAEIIEWLVEDGDPVSQGQ